MEETQKIHPQKFMMWIAIASMTMLFASLTSALVVKKGDVQNWVNFRLPNEFLYSTFIILLSSVSIQLALNAYKKAKSTMTLWLILTTVALAFMFVYYQLKGWETLNAIGMPLAGNPSGSFVYAISGIHGFHYVFGILFLIIIYIVTKFSKVDKSYGQLHQMNPSRLLHLELITTYWHYIGLVWLYIYLLFKFVIYQ